MRKFRCSVWTEDLYDKETKLGNGVAYCGVFEREATSLADFNSTLYYELVASIGVNRAIYFGTVSEKK